MDILSGHLSMQQTASRFLSMGSISSLINGPRRHLSSPPPVCVALAVFEVVWTWPGRNLCLAGTGADNGDAYGRRLLLAGVVLA